jgi:hypothetical protein
MYSITASASRLVAYRSESGSSWETRHSPSRLSPIGRPGQVLLFGEERSDLRGGVGGGKIGQG